MKNCYDVENVQLTAAQLLRAINSLIEVRQNPVSWPTLARWRKHWEQPHGPYSFDDAKVYAAYGDFIAMGFGVGAAKTHTLSKFQRLTNEQSSPQECPSSTNCTIDITSTATP